jgi:glycosyltransferase involved in cell wall biosynthesis
MKILYVVANLKTGGIQRVAARVSAEHVRQGHDVHLLCLGSGKALETDSGVTLHLLEKRTLFTRNPFWAAYWVLYKLLLRHLATGSEFIWAAPLYKRLYESKLAELEQNGQFDAIFVRGTRSIRHLHSTTHPGSIYSLHGTINWLNVHRNKLSLAYFSWLHRRIFSGKQMLFVSRELQQDFLAQAKIAGTQITSSTVVNNPCDLQMIRKLAAEPIGFSDPFIVSVGRLTTQKRYDILLRAYARIQTHCKLVLIGAGSQKSKLKKLAAELKLTDKVTFTGLDANPYRWVARAKMFVLSSDFEGFPNVVIEAVACRTPVVATRCSGVADILTGEMSRGLVDIGDIDGLARTMEEYLVNPIKPSATDAEPFSITLCAHKYIDAALGKA